jgi:hypothetical protein
MGGALSTGAVTGAEEMGSGLADGVVATSAAIDDFVGFVREDTLVFRV